jgi:hypothetical protein
VVVLLVEAVVVVSGVVVAQVVAPELVVHVTRAPKPVVVAVVEVLATQPAQAQPQP